jgi:hypothetical protein
MQRKEAARMRLMKFLLMATIWAALLAFIASCGRHW